MSFDETRRGENGSLPNTSEIKISPIKVPPGATQIGSYILGSSKIIKGKLSVVGHMAKYI